MQPTGPIEKIYALKERIREERLTIQQLESRLTNTRRSVSTLQQSLRGELEAFVADALDDAPEEKPAPIVVSLPPEPTVDNAVRHTRYKPGSIASRMIQLFSNVATGKSLFIIDIASALNIDVEVAKAKANTMVRHGTLVRPAPNNFALNRS